MTIDRRGVGVVLAGAAAFFDLYAPQAILPQLAADLNVDTHRVAWLITVSTLAVAVVGPFAGALADRFGRRRLIIAGAFAMAVPTLFVALATSFHEMLVLRAAVGALMPLIFCATVAYIGEEWDATTARAITARYMAGAVAGSFLGRFVCGVLTDVIGWRDAYFVLAAVNLTVAFSLLLLLPRERSFAASPGMRATLVTMVSYLRRPPLAAACAVGLLVLFAQVAMLTYANLLLAAPPFSLPPSLLAAVSAVFLLGMVTTPVIGARMRRFSEYVPLALGSALFIAGAGLTLAPSLPVIIAGMAVASAGTFLCQSAATSFVAARAPEARSAAIGVYTTFYYVGGSIGAVAPGFAWQTAGWPAVAGMMIAASALAMLVAQVFWRTRSRDAAAPIRVPMPAARTMLARATACADE